MKTFDQLNAEYLARYRFNVVYNYYLTRIALLPCVFFSWPLMRDYTMSPAESFYGHFLILPVIVVTVIAYPATWVFGFWLRPFVRVFSK
jgi:hypothetical protein